MLTLLAYVLTSFANPPQQYTPIPPNGSLYKVKGMCPGECAEVIAADGALIDPATITRQGGIFVVDAAKKAEKESEKKALRDAEDAKRAKAIAARETGVKNAKNWEELRQAVMDLMGIE